MIQYDINYIYVCVWVIALLKNISDPASKDI